MGKSTPFEYEVKVCLENMGKIMAGISSIEGDRNTFTI